MRALLLFITLVLGFQSAVANERPTLQFNGQTYYLARAFYETDYNYSPVNVVEWYLPVGQTSDNYTQSIKRLTYLSVMDYRTSANSRLAEFKEDNPNIPFEKIDDPENNRTILRVSFWWPFRPSILTKEVYIFQEDKEANRAMCYIISELEFFTPTKSTHEELVKKGKNLLIDNKMVDLIKELKF